MKRDKTTPGTVTGKNVINVMLAKQGIRPMITNRLLIKFKDRKDAGFKGIRFNLLRLFNHYEHDSNSLSVRCTSLRSAITHVNNRDMMII